MKAASLEELERRHPLGYTDRSGRNALAGRVAVVAATNVAFGQANSINS